MSMFLCAVALFGLSDSAAEIVASPRRVSDSASGSSSVPIIRRDGHRVLFLSQASNLASNESSSPHLNLYLHDLVTSNVTIVSVAVSGFGGANDDVGAANISGLGEKIVFQSAASNLATNDTNRLSDIFLRDNAGGTTKLISRSFSGEQSASGASMTPLLTRDGGRIVFQSSADDLVPNDGNGAGDIFAFDVALETVTIVSQDAVGPGGAIGSCEQPAISVDGQVVAFVKRATNAVAEGTSIAEVYLRDLESETTTWLSSGAGVWLASGASNRFRCIDPVVSDDGRAAAFLVAGTTAESGALVRYDRPSTTSRLVATNVPTRSPVTFSGDGQYLAFVTDGALFVYDHVSGSNRLASGCGPSGGPLTQCHNPTFSADGSRLAFLAYEGAVCSAFVYDRLGDCARVASVNTNGARVAVVPFSHLSFSENGRFLAFQSVASDLTANDFNQTDDVFVHDLEAGPTLLVSRRLASRPSMVGMRSALVRPSGVSADGNRIAFTSFDNELVPGNTNQHGNLYLVDRRSNSLTRISASLNDAAHANFATLSACGRYLVFMQDQASFKWLDLQTGRSELIENGGMVSPQAGAVLSADGQLVAFAPNQPDRPGNMTVVYRDMRSESVTNIAVATFSGSTTPRYYGGAAPMSFSSDGKWLAFYSRAWLGSQPSLIGGAKLYARNLETKETRMVYTNDHTAKAVFSADSRYLFFKNYPPGGPVFRYDLITTNLSTVCNGCANPSPNGSGSMIALESVRGVPPLGVLASAQVFVVDLNTGESNLVSMNVSGTSEANGRSFGPSITYDGRYVIFVSTADDLVTDDHNKAADIFVRDLRAHTTFLVSRNMWDTGAGDGWSSNPVLCTDGRTVLFLSSANDLAPGDYNQARDIFTMRLGSPDIDGDGIDQDWEWAYFDTASRDGTGDFDGDGASDISEFLAGTDPTNEGSVLRVITVSAQSGFTKVLWTSIPGRTYRIQFRNEIEGGTWADLPDVVTATGMTAFATVREEGSASRTFYRVLLVR